MPRIIAQGAGLTTGRLLRDGSGDEGSPRILVQASGLTVGRVIPGATVSPTAQGTVDATDPYILRLGALSPLGMTAPYSNYVVTLALLDQSNRTIVITGDALNAAPASLTDTASAITLAETGAIVCGPGTTIGGSPVTNGDTVNTFNGTMGSMEIVANLANLWGDINITVSVDDADTQTATVTL